MKGKKGKNERKIETKKQTKKDIFTYEHDLKKRIKLESYTPLLRDGKLIFGGEQLQDQDICL